MPKSAKTRVGAPRGPIPKHVQEALRSRLEIHARTNWKGRCRAIVVRFRGAFAYIDAFAVNDWYMPGTSSEEKARIDATPTHLCRLGYLGTPDVWEFGFYKDSDDKYEPSVVTSGSFHATPEEAFDCSASVYLEG